MAGLMTLRTLRLAACLILESLAASAQEIEAFAVDTIELFDDDENFLEEKPIAEIDLNDVTIDREQQKVGMLLLRMKDGEYWIYDSDVILSGKQPAKECQTVSRASESQLAASMGLGCK